MNKNLLMGDQTLFKDPEIFEPSHIPEHFDFRDGQLQQLAHNIKFALRGCTPVNTILYGLPGTGKTTSGRLLFSEIGQASQRVVPVYVNCREDKTRYSVFATIYRSIFGHYPPASGVAFRKIYNEIGNHLADNGKVAVVCLDDINYLVYENSINDVLYLLLRMYQDYPGAKTGVVGTAGSMGNELLNCLEPAVMSVFHPARIYYPPYGFEEVKAILLQRIRAGLYPGVITDEVLDAIAGHTEAGGDIRTGISILRDSVRNAENAGRKEVAMEDIPCISARQSSVEEALGSLSEAEMRFLRSVAKEIGRCGGVISSKELFDSVKGSLKIGHTIFHQRLSKLEMMRVLVVPENRFVNVPNDVFLAEGVGEILGPGL